MYALPVRVLLGIVLLGAAGTKLPRLRSFRAIVGEFHLLPSGLVTPAALLVPSAEAVLGVSFILIKPGRPTLACAAAMFGVFLAAVAINLLRGRRDISCGCFGGHHTIDWWLVARNAAFISLTISLWREPDGVPFLAVGSVILTACIARTLCHSVPMSHGTTVSR